MNDGWFKIWRKIFDNQYLKHNHTAFKLAVWCISMADKKTAKFTCGRRQMEEWTGIKGTTAYKCLKKLEKVGFCNIKSNNQFSEIYICKYHKYQANGNRVCNNEVTTSEQRSNTLQELRIKNIEYIYSEFNRVFGTKYKSNSIGTNLTYWLETYSLEEIKQAIEAAKKDKFWNDKITPTILLRRKNPRGESVDYIGQLLNKVATEPKEYIKGEV